MNFGGQCNMVTSADRFIDAFARYAPILTRIKHEYDEALRNHDRLQTEMCVTSAFSLPMP